MNDTLWQIRDAVTGSLYDRFPPRWPLRSVWIPTAEKLPYHIPRETGYHILAMVRDLGLLPPT